MAKFKVGDKIVGNRIERYGITKKGNGYGIVKRTNYSDDENDIMVEWYYEDGELCETNEDGLPEGSFWVNSRYFDLVLRQDKLQKLKKELIG